MTLYEAYLDPRRTDAPDPDEFECILRDVLIRFLADKPLTAERQDEVNAIIEMTLIKHLTLNGLTRH